MSCYANKNLGHRTACEPMGPAIHRHQAREIARLFRDEDGVYVYSHCDCVCVHFSCDIKKEYIQTLCDNEYRVNDSNRNLYIGDHDIVIIEVVKK